jgi:anaerobic selenocysteine-containing dehydrogenase
LIAIVSGQGAKADIAKLDDAAVAEDVRRIAGPHADTVLQTVSRWRGPERLIDLALRTGPYGDQFGAVPDGLNLDKVRAKPEGIDLGPLAPRVPELLRTPSGKIELAPALLLEDLARPKADLARPVPALVIVGRRHVRSNNSWVHNLPVLAKGPFRCTVLVNPDDATRLGLRHGGRARIARCGRAIEAQVEISDEMMPGVVSLPHGWGHDLPDTNLSVASDRPGANINSLFDENLRDPLSGNAVLSGVPVELHPV